MCRFLDSRILLSIDSVPPRYTQQNTSTRRDDAQQHTHAVVVASESNSQFR